MKKNFETRIIKNWQEHRWTVKGKYSYSIRKVVDNNGNWYYVFIRVLTALRNIEYLNNNGQIVSAEEIIDVCKF